MNSATLIDRMTDVVNQTKNDRLANALLKLINRLAHQGAPFEKPLTKNEIKSIMKFVDPQ